MRYLKILLLAFLAFVDVVPRATPAQTIIGSLPFTLQNGSIADANQVMANFNTIVSQVNANAAGAGANTNITALNGLTTPLVYTSGGTSNYIGGTSGGSANAQVIASPIPSGFSLLTGLSVTFISGFNNTGPTQLNVNATGLKNLFRQTATGAVAMAGGELVSGQVYTAVYDGTEFQISGPSPQNTVQPCTVIDWAGANGGPSGYLLMNGQTVSRTTFATLFSCIAVQNVSATTTSGNNSIVVPNSALFQIGWVVGGNNVVCGTNIISIPDGTHIVTSSNASANGATTLTIGPYSQGDCSTTFGVGNFLGRATIMRDTVGSTLTTATCANPATIGSLCGGQTQTLTLAQLPTGITSSGSASVTTGNAGAPVANASFSDLSFTPSGSGTHVPSATGWSVSNTFTGSASVTSNNTSGSAHPILPPVALVDKYIKF